MIINCNIDSGGMVLHDLYMLGAYFEEPATLVMEADLVQHYGRAAVRDALDRGLLERHPIPCCCGPGGLRYVCRLSQTGYRQAYAALGPA